LKRIDRAAKKHLDVRFVLDNDGTHKTPEVIPASNCIARRLRPLVERFFAKTTTKRFRRRACTSVAKLEETIHDYLECHNADPKPFVWTKSAQGILDKEARALAALRTIKGRNQQAEH